MKRLIFPTLLCAASVSMGCESTSSTEVGVRTSLFGIIEARGTQQVYQPGGIYVVAPFVNAWTTLPIRQQNLTMNADPQESSSPIADDITFKTKDGNNVYIDVNVMWRIDAAKAGLVITQVGQSVSEIEERILRPMSRSVIRDVFNEITSEEYYQVTVKNRVAEEARQKLSEALAPYGVVIDMLQVQQHRFDPAYQEAINAQKQAEADREKIVEQQKAMDEQKQAELEAKRAEWNRRMEDALGEAGKVRNEADGYFQVKSNEAKAVLATARAESEATKKAAEALAKVGGEGYVKMALAKRLKDKRITLVPQTGASTLDVNALLQSLAVKRQQTQTAD
jgi:regulator of protease activity HflC (stomatin/prohibitin superfamily)